MFKYAPTTGQPSQRQIRVWTMQLTFGIMCLNNAFKHLEWQNVHFFKPPKDNCRTLGVSFKPSQKPKHYRLLHRSSFFKILSQAPKITEAMPMSCCLGSAPECVWEMWLFCTELKLLGVWGTGRRNSLFRSICGGRWRGQTHRTPACWSTSAGKWTERPRWSHRSKQNISSQEEQWSARREERKGFTKRTSEQLTASHKESCSPWFSWCLGPRRLFLSAYGRQYQGTWWFHQTTHCWHKGPYECQCHTSWCCCKRFHGCQQTPYLRKLHNKCFMNLQ